MPQVEFEPTTPMFERVKTVHALDRAATVIGQEDIWSSKCIAPRILYLLDRLRKWEIVLK
jgi:hypothetical protein